MCNVTQPCSSSSACPGTIFIIVALMGWHSCGAHWQFAVNLATVGTASCLHHGFPKQRSLFHWLDNVALLWAALCFTHRWPTLLYATLLPL